MEPVAALGAVAQIATGLAVDPFGEVDPFFDFFGSFAVPGEVFGEVAIGFGGVVSEAFEDVDAYFFCFGV